MIKRIVVGLVAVAAVLGLSTGVSWSSTTPSPTVTAAHKPVPHKHFNLCPTAVTHDHLAKTDNGHGTPSEWADLSFNRTVVAVGHYNRKARACDYKITLKDRGSFTTRAHTGSPSGAAVQIVKKVPGTFVGVYHLTLTGFLKPHVHHGDVTAAGSTAYVQSLVKVGIVAGGDYAWYYRTVCGEHWLDSSKNNDGQDLSAGNITGKWCRACGGHGPKPTPTPTPTGSVTPTPTPSPTETVPAGEAPAPVTVPAPKGFAVTG
jgi:hypothetical protein